MKLHRSQQVKASFRNTDPIKEDTLDTHRTKQVSQALAGPILAPSTVGTLQSYGPTYRSDLALA